MVTHPLGYETLRSPSTEVLIRRNICLRTVSCTATALSFELQRKGRALNGLRGKGLQRMGGAVEAPGINNLSRNYKLPDILLHTVICDLLLAWSLLLYTEIWETTTKGKNSEMNISDGNHYHYYNSFCHYHKSLLIHSFISQASCWHQEPEKRSRYSNWLQAGRPKVRSSSPGRVKIFLLFTSSTPLLGPTQPLSLVVKRPGREANYSTPASAEVKNTWIYTSTRSYVFMA
jgi:hypothetical protein